MEIKTTVNKRDLIKLKSFHKAKETISKMKRQPSEWERVFVNKASDKVLISKISKEIMQLNIKKQKQPNQTMAEDLNIHFSKEDTQMGNTYLKRRYDCSY